MYAVIKTGGKQYRVAKDDVIKIEKVEGEAGDKIEFGEILILGSDDETTIGAPLVEGAKVTGEVLEQGRASKIIVFKKKRRHNYRRKKGHRQHQTVVRITDISK
ncbi:MAG: 50S ribosomal protein L21 [Rhodomicrobium sp.]|nr:MAG: 50S ribosomal protein L21 [Rhodomicrobium sp.]